MWLNCILIGFCGSIMFCLLGFVMLVGVFIIVSI